MRWEKLGCIFTVDRRSWWQVSHAYLPTAIVCGDSVRVFLAFRDANNVGRLGWIDVASSDPSKVLAVSQEPSLDIGEPGAFDDNGVSPLSVVLHGQRLFMYYAGWQLTPRARYLLLTGLAVSDDLGHTFSRVSTVPVMERSSKEMLIRSGTFVMHDDGVWKAWYAAGRSLTEANGALVPTYCTSYMESQDGIHWPGEGQVALTPVEPDEYGFGRPWVARTATGFEMIYSIRSKSKIYRLGYGTSPDGRIWTRRDGEVGIDCSESGWDAEMIGFASVVRLPGGTYLFYNGNDYGRTGVGLARLIER